MPAKFGIIATNWGEYPKRPNLYEELAVAAEESGYESFFVTEHYMRPMRAGEELPPHEHVTIDSWVILSRVSAKTSKIKLGTCVTPITLRPPQLLAKIVASLDILSGGRAILGVGSGYDEREFRAYSPYPWERPGMRVKRFKEALTLIIKLWEEEKVDFHGKFYTAEGAVLEPKPVQRPHPPIWTGAMSKKMLEITASLADGWAPSRALGATLDFYKNMRAELSRLSSEKGRSLVYGIMGFFIEGEIPPQLVQFGKFDDAHKIIESYLEVGCEYFIVGFLPSVRAVELAKKFSKEVMPSFT